MGGEAPWLFPPRPLPPHELKCPACGGDVAFLAAVYAPADDVNEGAFHRDVVVCVCVSRTCHEANTPRRALCVRMQLPRTNKWYAEDGSAPVRRPTFEAPATGTLLAPPLCHAVGVVVGGGEDEASKTDGDVDEENDEEDEEVETKHAPAASALLEKPITTSGSCEVCRAPSTTRCSQCHRAFYCSVEHQRTHWKEGGHREACTALANRGGESTRMMREAGLLPESRVVEAHDPAFARFERIVRKAPKQVVRYHRWPPAASTEAGAVWPSSASRDAPPACESCGAPRSFEMQIMPQTLAHLPLDTAVDFTTIAVFTCTKSCGSSADGVWREEWAWVQ